MTKYSNLSTKTKLSSNKSPKLRHPTKNENLSTEHTNKEPIVNFKFAMPSSLAIPVLEHITSRIALNNCEAVIGLDS